MLVALSGVIDLQDAEVGVLQNLKIFLLCYAGGEAWDTNVQASSAYVLKGVQLQSIADNGFVYNMLLSSNQVLELPRTGDGSGVNIIQGN